MTVKLEANCDDDLSNNNLNSQNSAEVILEEINSGSLAPSVVTSTGLSLDSVVQRLIDKKMGRRKQNCPQRTGITSEDGKILRGLFSRGQPSCKGSHESNRDGQMYRQ